MDCSRLRIATARRCWTDRKASKWDAGEARKDAWPRTTSFRPSRPEEGINKILVGESVTRLFITRQLLGTLEKLRLGDTKFRAVAQTKWFLLGDRDANTYKRWGRGVFQGLNENACSREGSRIFHRAQSVCLIVESSKINVSTLLFWTINEELRREVIYKDIAMTGLWEVTYTTMEFGR